MLLIRDAAVTGQEIVVVHHQRERMARKMVKMVSKAMGELQNKMEIRSQDKDVLEEDLDVVDSVADMADTDVVNQSVMEPHQKAMEQLVNLKANVP
jgi:3-hydroxyacyl-CoA dehydrogenase